MNTPRYGMGLGLALLAGAACGKSSPTGLEALPENIATVLAGVDRFTTGQVFIHANCGGSPPINCPGGVAANPAPLTFTRDSVLITPTADSSMYTFYARVAIASVHDIPITVPIVGDCGFAINTAPGTPAVVITGGAHFTSQTDSGPINRVDFSDEAITGLDSADVGITGPGLCSYASLGIGVFLGTIVSAVIQAAQPLCGAPGSPLFEPCPPKLVAMPDRRRTRYDP